jgi:hypothetical protein
MPSSSSLMPSFWPARPVERLTLLRWRQRRPHGHGAELCDHSGLLPARTCRARERCTESLALWLGVRRSIRGWSDRQPMGASGRALSAKRVSIRFRPLPCRTVSCAGLVCVAIAPSARPPNLSLAPAGRSGTWQPAPIHGNADGRSFSGTVPPDRMVIPTSDRRRASVPPGVHVPAARTADRLLRFNQQQQ